MPVETHRVMISSTVEDAAEYRWEAMDACLRVGMLPVMMEHRSASHDTPLDTSRGLVDSADVYVGVIAHRYGSVAPDHRKSFTELEYDRASERGIKRLMFVMDDSVPVVPRHVEGGEGGRKLADLKNRLYADFTLASFKSCDDLRQKVYQSLKEWQEREPPTMGGPILEPLPPQDARGCRIQHLEPSIRRFHAQVDACRWAEALSTFNLELFAMLVESGAADRSVALLKRFFPEGDEDGEPLLERAANGCFALNALGLSYLATGRPGRAVSLFARAAEVDRAADPAQRRINPLRNQARALVLCGRLNEAGEVLPEAPEGIQRRNIGLQESWLLMDRFQISALCGFLDPQPVQDALRAFHEGRYHRGEETAHVLRAQRVLWKCIEAGFTALDDSSTRYIDLRDALRGAVKSCNDALGLAQERASGPGIARAYRLQGNVLLLDREASPDAAVEQLSSALGQAQRHSWVEEEIPCRIGLAEACRRGGAYEKALSVLEKVWQPIWEGPYRLFEADAFNVLARIQRDLGNRAAAAAAASRAYAAAWCDGPPYAYHWGLLAARRELEALGAPEPMMEQRRSDA